MKQMYKKTNRTVDKNLVLYKVKINPLPNYCTITNKWKEHIEKWYNATDLNFEDNEEWPQDFTKVKIY